MGYWKLLLISILVLSVLSVFAYGWTYFIHVIIFKDSMSMFGWMWNFIMLLSVIIASFFSDREK